MMQHAINVNYICISHLNTLQIYLIETHSDKLIEKEKKIEFHWV